MPETSLSFHRRTLRDTARRYGGALIGVIVVTLLRYAAGRLVGDFAPFSVYTIAVAFAAWYGGFGPALLSLGLGVICALGLFAQSGLLGNPQRRWAFGLAIVTSLMVAALGAARRRAERRAASRQEDLDQVLRQMNEAFIVINRQWRVMYLNDQAVQWLERPRGDLIGQTLWQIWPVKVDRALQDDLNAVMERGEPRRFELPLDSADRWVETHASPAAQGITLAISDISQRKAAEVQVRQSLSNERAAREEAEQANRAKDEFLATLSHELRTPLNSMLGWAQLLNMGPQSPEEIRQGISAIERSARNQAQLIEDLLDMSRITSGRMKLDITSVNMADVVNAALEAAAPAANAKRITLERQWSLENLAPVSGDPVRLQQIVWNILTNAVKFTPAHGKISVSILHDAETVQVVIRDSGEGIDPQFMPQIFGRFQQADGSSTRRHGGLGLGLAIVRHLTELHGGTITAESLGRDRGSTFTLRLPRMRVQAPASGRAPVENGERPNLSGLQVLVVDDEPETRDLVRRVLAAANADVSTAGSAADAFAALRSRPPDVLVSDIAMPEEDGYGLIARVRSLPREQGGGVPALALTAFARPEDQARALASGFQLHLAKPIDAHHLLKSIARLAADDKARN